MNGRILFRRFARNSRVLIGTSLGAGLYTVGCWLQGKSAKPKRPDDPVGASLYDMQNYLDLAMLQHCLSYQILKDEAEDYRKPCPSRDEYDAEKQLPPPFRSGDDVNPSEVNYICQALHYDEPAITALMQHDPRLVMNYLRIKYWEHWSRESQQPKMLEDD